MWTVIPRLEAEPFPYQGTVPVKIEDILRNLDALNKQVKLVEERLSKLEQF